MKCLMLLKYCISTKGMINMNERIKKQEIAKQKLNQHIKHLKIEMNQKIDKLYDDFYKEFQEILSKIREE